jgi:predicted RND superfamily exporter protein
LARQRGEDLTRAAHEAGRGVVLTNVTTCAGFLALVLSRVPGLRNGGLIICVGNLLCLIATLLVLPAIDALRRREPRTERLEGPAAVAPRPAE